jgi:hypothetical protein
MNDGIRFKCSAGVLACGYPHRPGAYLYSVGGASVPASRPLLLKREDSSRGRSLHHFQWLNRNPGAEIRCARAARRRLHSQPGRPRYGMSKYQ